MATTKRTRKPKKYEILVSFSDITDNNYISYAKGQVVEMDSKMSKRYKKFIKPYIEKEVE